MTTVSVRNIWGHGQYTHTRRRKLDNKSVQYPLVVLESNTSALKSDKECSGPEEQLNNLDYIFNSVPSSEKTSAVLRLLRTLSKDQRIFIKDVMDFCDG